MANGILWGERCQFHRKSEEEKSAREQQQEEGRQPVSLYSEKKRGEEKSPFANGKQRQNRLSKKPGASIQGENVRNGGKEKEGNRSASETGEGGTLTPL